MPTPERERRAASEWGDAMTEKACLTRRAAGAVASLALAAATFATPVSAAPDVPPPPGQIGHPYQRELSKSCLGAGCSLDFPVVPAKRRLDLSLANCAVQGSGKVSSVAIFLNDGSTPLISHELIERQAIVLGSQTRHLFSEPVELSAVTGRHITASVLMNSGPVGIRCSLFGTLVVLP